MKIAIQGHSTRGKEVIQILESLGGKNKWFHEGTNENCFYELHDDVIWCANTRSEHFKYYTLEEFEKEFPFKIGDIVQTVPNGQPGIITKLCSDPVFVLAYKIRYNSKRELLFPAQILKLYQSMKEERNITLTLNKAKEWYKKGGELKEIALQAFTEKELNPLPKSWEEFCKQGNPMASWRYSIPTKYEALYQLEQLRNCWCGDWKPVWGISQKWCIRLFNGIPSLGITTNISKFLTFPTREMAEEFLECFRDLIEKAGDLI